jgi:hypothetical protein
LYPKDSITLGEGRGNAFIVFLKRGRKEIAFKGWELQRSPGTSEETIPGGQADVRKPLEEDDRKAGLGKTECPV